MVLNDIHFHDSIIKVVIENTAIDELRMEVEYPVNWSEDKFSQAFLVFSDVHKYEVHEIPFEGSPTILDVEVISESQERKEIKINTNAGFRSFSFTNVKIEWPDNDNNVVEKMFYSQKRDNWFRFVLNDHVKIESGEHSGSTGSVISIVSDNPDIEYLVELDNGKGDIRASGSSLFLLGEDEDET